MRWICEIDRAYDGLYANVLDGKRVDRVRLDDRSAIGLSANRTDPLNDTRTLLVVWPTYELTRMVLLDRTEGSPPLAALASQFFFTARASGRQFVVPAQELIQILFGRTSSCWRSLMTPRPPPIVYREAALAQRSAQTLDWVGRFPSAGASWASVYRFALDRTFGLQLPKANLDVQFDFNPAHRTPIARRMRLWGLVPLESPKSGGPLGEQRSFKPRLPRIIDGVLAKNGSSSVTDHEWQLIQDQILNTHRLVDDHRWNRGLVNLVLEKYGRGISWALAHANHPTFGGGLSLEKRLRSEERFDRLFELIVRLRR